MLGGRRRTTVALLAAALGAMVSLPAARAADEAVPLLAGIRSDGGRLVDSEGRTVVLRGINAVDKNGWDGRLAPPILDAAAIDQIAALGFNHVRLGLTWASVEHERDRFDDAYIDQLIGVLDGLQARGLVAVVDVHQDVWSEALGYDGAPAWADPQCNRPPAVPLDQVTGTWFAQYGSPDVNAAWANFWQDGYGPADPHCTGAVQSEFVDMWRHLASRLAGHPAVIGYDLLNEPWPSAPPGVFETTQLMPMYERVAGAIRAVDPETPIFFGPAPYSPALPTLALAPPDPNAVFAPHIYTETMFSGGRVTTGARTDELTLIKDLKEGRRMGVPVWIGEWGALNDQTYVGQMYDLFDRYGASAAFWLYAQTPGERLAARDEAAHVRVYPEAYPGTATWEFDAATNTFAMTLAVGPGTHQARIVVPDRLGLTTTDPAVSFSAGRAVWTVQGPGTFTLRLESRP